MLTIIHAGFMGSIKTLHSDLILLERAVFCVMRLDCVIFLQKQIHS